MIVLDADGPVPRDQELEGPNWLFGSKLSDENILT